MTASSLCRWDDTVVAPALHGRFTDLNGTGDLPGSNKLLHHDLHVLNDLDMVLWINYLPTIPKGKIFGWQKSPLTEEFLADSAILGEIRPTYIRMHRYRIGQGLMNGMNALPQTLETLAQVSAAVSDKG